MRVTIRVRALENWGSGPFTPELCTVDISDTCPTCGGPRGEVRGMNQYEDGVYYHVNVWDNPCGHIDLYADVAREAGLVST